MERYRKSVYYTALIHFILGWIVTLQEGPTLPPDEQPGYYIFRTILLTMMFLVLKPLKKDPFNKNLSLTVAILYAVYSIHGQYYNPWYIFCFIQLLYGIAFLYPIGRRTFLWYTLISTTLFSTMLFYRFETFTRWAANPIKEDIFITILCSATIGVLANYFFTADRSYREETIRKFGLIGIQSAALVHDIKGLMSAPRLYSQILIEKLARYNDPEASKAVEALNSSLQQFNTVLIELNRMSTLHVQVAEQFGLNDIIQDVSEALSLDRKNIQIDQNAKLQIHAEKALFKSIVFNIVLNSLQSFRRNNIENPKISIFTNEKKQLVFGDNAGGFSQELLQKLTEGKFEPSQGIGTGLGTYLIMDSMRSLGGAAKFQNSSEGAEVILTFPKHLVRA